MNIIDKHNANKYTWGINCESFVFLETESLSVKQELMPPGTNEQLHFHTIAQQVFYVSKGEATFYVEENQSIHIEPGQKHFVVNNSSVDLEFLVISQPSTKNDRIQV